jgi:FtsP/CotA-like multicopper oxidase with cupredoxin domain
MQRTLSSAVLALAAAALPLAAQERPTHRQEIDPSWLTYDTTTRTAEFQLIAGLTGYRGALNFNGFADGELTFEVPLNWRVVMYFRNQDGVLPHSAQIIEDQQPVPPGPVQSAFRGAQTIKLAQGLQARETDDLRFVANRAGSFLIFCAVPGHGLAGMWTRFRVSAEARVPSMYKTAEGGS